LTETDARIVIVDKHAMPGGHWNDAYGFVRLHQPSAYYGVGSRPLGSNRIDESGLNKGYYELPSGAEVSAYFDALMRERFLPSGRVQYFPMCDYRGDGKFASLLSGAEQTVPYRKLVDATFFRTLVPATHTPKFEIGDGVTLVAPHRLHAVAPGYKQFVIIGAGKTAMDTCVWLIQMGADPSSIRWIVPRDSWLINREITQPGETFVANNMGGLAHQMEASADAANLDDLFDRLERTGQLLRIDPSVRPTMYRGATISRAEVEVLRTIKDIVRKGHVRAIAPERVAFDHDEIAAAANSLFIDCSAVPLSARPPEPIFAGDRITIQMVRAQLVSISAATVAHVEAAYTDEAEKNALCQPIPAASTDVDWARCMLADLHNSKRWAADKPLRRWVSEHRLSGFGAKPNDPEAEAIGRRIRDARPRAEANLTRLLAELDAQ
jgi:hypothetical protein